jgi:hypothetical protein
MELDRLTKQNIRYVAKDGLQDAQFSTRFTNVEQHEIDAPVKIIV